MMTEINSVNNEIVKNAVKLQQKKYRDDSGKFLLEGYKSVNEALNSGIKLERIFILKEKFSEYKSIPQNLITPVNSAILKKISTTDTPPDIVAVGFQPENDFKKLEQSKKVILIENIQDAGNLGTIIRSAVAFGLDSIVLYGNTIDLYNPKCVRATVGNLWKINIVLIETKTVLNKYFKDFVRVATLPESTNSILLNEWKPSDRTLLMFGSEATGLSDELKNYATQNLTIEMNKNVESLNLSVSAGIIMHKMQGVKG